MQIVKCDVGMWKAEARVEEVDGAKLMAIISAMAEHNHCAIESKHVVVFDHIEGSDEAEETKAVMQRILQKAH